MVRYGLIFVLILSFLTPLGGAEVQRHDSLDIFVIIDGSPGLKNVREEALSWFSTQIVDRLLQEGDRLSVWIAGDRAELVFSGTLGESESGESLMKRLGAADFSGKAADFAGALREAAARKPSVRGGLPPYILLIASSEGLSPSLGGNPEMFLRYSRVDEFSGWRAIRLADDIGAQVREAASAYMGRGR